VVVHQGKVVHQGRVVSRLTEPLLDQVSDTPRGDEGVGGPARLCCQFCVCPFFTCTTPDCNVAV
jgi:hypothetical protein